MTIIDFYSGADGVGNATLRVLDYDGNGIFLDYGPKHEWGMDSVCKPVAKHIVLSHGHRDHVAAIGQYAIRRLKRSLRRAHSEIFDREHVLSEEPDILYLPKFYGTEQTKEAVKLQIADSAKIAISNRKNFSRKRGELLFDESDVEELLGAIDKRWVSTDDHREVAIGDFRIRQVSAGHIAGSAITEVTHNDVYSGRSKKVVYTGDLSFNKNLLGEGPESWLIEKGCDLLVMESTYGDVVDRPPMEARVREFKEKIKQYVSKGKTIFLPVFALERSQMAVKYVNEALAELPKSEIEGYSLYYLSSLGEKFREKIYTGLDMGDFGFEKSKERFEGDGKTLRKPAIIIASSGSGEGGYTAGLLPEIVGNTDAVVFRTTSFMPPDSPVEEIWKNGRLTVRHGKKVEKIKVRAELDSVSLSVHASQDELAEIALTLQPKKIALVHGGPEARRALAEKLGTLGYEVVQPMDGDALVI